MRSLKKILFDSLSFVFAPLLVCSCGTDNHDYLYLITSSVPDSVRLSYKLIDEDTAHHVWLKAGDTLSLACRGGVVGEDIWDVETSSSIYMFDSLMAITADSLKKTENLIARSFWPPQPVKRDGKGVYVLSLDENDLILKRMESYTYVVKSESENMVIISLGDDKSVLKDTLVGNHKRAELLVSPIYTYINEADKTEQERHTIILNRLNFFSLKLEKDDEVYARTISLSKEDSLFTFYGDSCLLIVRDNLFPIYINK